MTVCIYRDIHTLQPYIIDFTQRGCHILSYWLDTYRCFISFFYSENTPLLNPPLSHLFDHMKYPNPLIYNGIYLLYKLIQSIQRWPKYSLLQKYMNITYFHLVSSMVGLKTIREVSLYLTITWLTWDGHSINFINNTWCHNTNLQLNASFYVSSTRV